MVDLLPLVLLLIGAAVAICGLLQQTSASQRELRSSEALFRHLFDSSPFPAVVTRLSDSAVLAINQRTSDRFGFTMEQAVGLNPRVFYVDPARRWADCSPRPSSRRPTVKPIPGASSIFSPPEKPPS
jgi:PAS domain-containing protein